MFCRKCGTELSDKDNFCFNCGTPIPESNAEKTISKEKTIPRKSKKIVDEFDELLDLNINEISEDNIIWQEVPFDDSIDETIDFNENKSKPKTKEEAVVKKPFNNQKEESISQIKPSKNASELRSTKSTIANPIKPKSRKLKTEPKEDSSIMEEQVSNNIDVVSDDILVDDVVVDDVVSDDILVDDVVVDDVVSDDISIDDVVVDDVVSDDILVDDVVVDDVVSDDILVDDVVVDDVVSDDILVDDVVGDNIEEELTVSKDVADIKTASADINIKQETTSKITENTDDIDLEELIESDFEEEPIKEKIVSSDSKSNNTFKQEVSTEDKAIQSQFNKNLDDELEDYDVDLDENINNLTSKFVTVLIMILILIIAVVVVMTLIQYVGI
ncbi:zinc ribbon domain-containing protein [Methanosphaera sp. WGK6]|uniref:zinc ribbon domain-containing protein n=1 Tax=Methanosphaera sp. WGK6 TaxID=1561964 RepID=UPI00084C9E85|nr:zinc ribbon domain-containing protein [Methanosphaera sp. WGK6]OED30651.1 hypothetical protein NL43_01540 [Methanosphaera sp. WGK6]